MDRKTLKAKIKVSMPACGWLSPWFSLYVKFPSLVRFAIVVEWPGN